MIGEGEIPFKRTANDASKMNLNNNDEFPPPGYQESIEGTVVSTTIAEGIQQCDPLLMNRVNSWVQLSGNPGTFAPAGPNTIWKKCPHGKSTETDVYRHLMRDEIKHCVPRFYREVEYRGNLFIEVEDLLNKFHSPQVMDIKIGTRTFQECEFEDTVFRKDLYEKMVSMDPDEPTCEENEDKAITKRRYIQFRERTSSTSAFGFRKIRVTGRPPNNDFKRVRTKEQISSVIIKYLNQNLEVWRLLLQRLKSIRDSFEQSSYFKNHEIVGSSLLIFYDQENHTGAWMIDFAKVLPVGDGRTLTHRTDWQPGNQEDGYLTGLDNLIAIWEELDLTPLPKQSPGSCTDLPQQQCSTTEQCNGIPAQDTLCLT